MRSFPTVVPRKLLVSFLIFYVICPIRNHQFSLLFHYTRSLKNSNNSYLLVLGNPFPPLLFDGSRNKNFIHNVLLDEARKEFKKAHHAEIIAKVSSSEKQNTSPSSNVKKTGNEALSKAAVDVSEGEQLLKSSVLSNEDENNSEKVESKNDPVLA